MFFSASGARFKDGFDGVSWLVVRNSVKNLGLTLFPVGLIQTAVHLPPTPKPTFTALQATPAGKMTQEAHVGVRERVARAR